MSKLEFNKYHGTGNDFIILDNRNETFNANKDLINKLCNRHFGIGADGLLLLENDPQHSNFYMRFFNPDGRESTMCGNGGRCMAAFAQSLGIGSSEIIRFNSIDGLHEAEIISKKGNEYIVKLKMADVPEVHEDDDFYYMNTGSPHHVCFVENVKEFDVVNDGKRISHSDMYAPDEVNVNFVELLDNDGIFIRTFERGVEDETLSCGTGVTASAIATALLTESDETAFNIKTLGGNLKVSFERGNNGTFKNIYLQGSATFVFKGEIYL